MRTKVRLCISAFIITAILLFLIFGFTMVDLRLSGNMSQEKTVPLLQITEFGNEKAEVSFFGQIYEIDSAPMKNTAEFLDDNSALLPFSVRLWGAIAAKASEELTE